MADYQILRIILTLIKEQLLLDTTISRIDGVFQKKKRNGTICLLIILKINLRVSSCSTNDIKDGAMIKRKKIGFIKN